MEELKLLLMFLTVCGYSYVLQPVTQTAGLDRDHQTEIRSDQLGDVSRSVEEEGKTEERTKMAPQMFSIILRRETKKEELSVADRVTEKNKDMERKKDKQTQETKEILTGDMTKTINSHDRQIEEDTTADEEFQKSDQMAKLKRENAEEERESRLVAGINLSDDTRGEMMWTVNQENLEKKAGEEEKEDHMVVSDLTLPATIQIITQSQNPPVHHHNVPESLLVAPTQVSSNPPTPHARVSPDFLHPSVTLPNPTTINHIPLSTVLPGESRAISLFEDLLTEVLQSQLKQNELEVKAGPHSEDVMGKNILFKPARQRLRTAVAQPKHMTEYIAQEATAKPKDITFITKDLNEPKTTPKSNENNPTVELKPIMTLYKLLENDTKFAARRNKASPPQPQTTKPSARPRMRPTKLSRKSGNKTKAKKRKKDNKTQKPPEKEVIMPTPFPYFKDNYCPPECACYGRVVQCSDKGVDKVPYGIPYNARYVLLMNNHINSIQLDLLNEYVSMEFLVLSNNRLIDGTIEGAFEGVPALKRLYLDRNLLGSIPTDLPMSLEELRLDNNRLTVMSEAAWARCPGLLVLSLSNNSLGNGSDSLPTAVLSPLRSLRTLNLDYNQLTSVPLGLPLSIKELYLKGNLIEQFRGGAFNGISELMVLDVSTNRLTNKGLPRESLLNATQLESLNLEGNRLKQVPRYLPRSLKTLNLEGNLISSIKKVAFSTLKNLEHLGLARNKIVKVAPGAFRTLPVLHQLDLCHNAMRQVPRQLPEALHSVALNNNKIQSVPRDAFCWGTKSLSGLVRVQLEHNLIDMGKLDAQAFRCLRGFQVVHFY